MKTNRRQFLQTGTLVTAVGLSAQAAASAANSANAAPTPQKPDSLPLPPTVRKGDMLYRSFGSTNEQVSVIGLGGFHIGTQPNPADSVRLIRAAIDRGITFLDNCWDYNNGASEERMGDALQNGYRDKVFLMTKIDGRSKKAAADQLEESLRRLKTDRIDLMQLHEIIRLEDPDRIFAKGGAMEALTAAKQAGKVRYIGFTGHKDPLVHQRMLRIAAEHHFHFDAVQMPINIMDAHFRSFRSDVLPLLVKDGIAPLAMKTFGGDTALLRHVRESGAATPIDLLHFSLSQPVSVVITGIDSEAILDQALTATRTFAPMPQKQQAELLAKVEKAAQSGDYEKFKTTQHFDGTAHNPQWLG